MKTTMKNLLGSIAIASAMVMVPVATFATSSTSTNVNINQSGNINLKNVEVTSISGNIINAILRFSNSLTSFTLPVMVTTNASTTISAGTSTKALLTDIKVGDKLNVTGLFTTFGTALNLTATKIKDVTSFIPAFNNMKSGTVQSVNLANNSFVIMTKDNKLVTVQNSASTTFFLGNKLASTFALVAIVNTKVEVKGVMNADNTVLTATSVSLKSSNDDKNEKKDKKEKDDNRDSSKHGNSGKSESRGNKTENR